MEKLQISMAAARVNAGLRQIDLANKVGVGVCTVIAWESGKSVPKVTLIPLLEKAYGIPIENIDFTRS